MAATKFNPEKITSPIQLMAAWFAMLVILVSIILTAAINISKPDWAAGFLVIFSFIVTIIVICCVTLMLTVFRPHLQEGKEYAQWLKDKNVYSAGVVRSEHIAKRLVAKKISETSSASEEIRKNFIINVSNLPGASELITSLSRAGYRAEVYEDKFPDDEDNVASRHESIWVGRNVPSKYAIETIKIALRRWPHLKYLHLSSDGGAPPEEVHNEMYFGGSSSTAEEYGLRAWSKEEIFDLGEDISKSDFHSIIRSKYA